MHKQKTCPHCDEVDQTQSMSFKILWPGIPHSCTSKGIVEHEESYTILNFERKQPEIRAGRM